MAAVWAARLRGKHGFEKTVAVKMIRDEYASDPRFRQMFLDEAHIAAGIEHINVAQILDLGEHQGMLYLVMELVDGEPITRLMRVAESRGEQIPVAIACRIIADACAGLHAAHELRDRAGHVLGVVHRDVSPQNILVTGRGVPKLIDFGVAKARDRVSEDTNAGTIKGKVSYMAPEQIFGKDLDRRADVWAIGAVLHHILSGSPPFDGGSPASTLRKIMGSDPPAPLPDRVPGEVAAVILRALERDQDARYPTAAALRADLEKAMHASGLVATTDQVGAYCAEQLAEREAARRSSLVSALSAAAERAKGRPASIPPPREASLEDSIARLSPSERAALAVKLAGGLGSESGDNESAARLLVALGAAMRAPSGLSDSGIRGVQDGASASTPVVEAQPERRGRGGAFAVLLVAVVGVAAVFAASKFLLEAPPAARSAEPVPAATSAPTAAPIASQSAAPTVAATPSTPPAVAPSIAPTTVPETKKVAAPAPAKKKSAGTTSKSSEGSEEPRVDDGF